MLAFLLQIFNEHFPQDNAQPLSIWFSTDNCWAAFHPRGNYVTATDLFVHHIMNWR